MIDIVPKLMKFDNFWGKLIFLKNKLKYFDKKLKEFGPKLENPPILSW